MQRPRRDPRAPRQLLLRDAQLTAAAQHEIAKGNRRQVLGGVRGGYVGGGDRDSGYRNHLRHLPLRLGVANDFAHGCKADRILPALGKSLEVRGVRKYLERDRELHRSLAGTPLAATAGVADTRRLNLDVLESDNHVTFSFASFNRPSM